MSSVPSDGPSPRLPVAAAATPLGLRVSQALAWGAILLSVLLPPGGLGFSLCFFYLITGLPCPGCGMTRAFIDIGHLNLAHSMQYHPLGLVAFAVAGIVALSAPIAPLGRRLVAYRQLVGRLLLLLAFFVFLVGAIRLVAVAVGMEGLAELTAFAHPKPRHRE